MDVNQRPLDTQTHRPGAMGDDKPLASNLASMAVPALAKSNPATRRACLACAKAKVRCDPHLEPGSTRCQSTTTPQAEGNKTKLDGIVTLLAASQRVPKDGDVDSPPESSNTSAGASRSESDARSASKILSLVPEDVERVLETSPVFEGSLFIPPERQQTTPLAVQTIGDFSAFHHEPSIDEPNYRSFPGFEMTFEEAGRVLNLYRSQMAAHCPFVIVPLQTTAHQLRHEKPFLFMSVITAASYENLALQRALGEEIMKYLSVHLLLRGEKSLELLQGLLVYLFWHHYHFKPGNQQLYKLIQLAIALVVDLKLNETPPRANTKQKIAIEVSHPSTEESALNRSVYGSFEEKRALVGCYYLSSAVSMSFKKLNALRFTQRIEDCCQALAEAAEYSSDVDLVHCVRLQNIAEKISQYFPYGEPFAAQTPNLPLEMYVKALQTELQAFLNGLSFNFQQNPLLLMQFYNVEVHLYEIGIHDPYHTHASQTENLPLRRLEILYDCLVSIKNYFEVFFTLPYTRYFGFTFVEWTQMSYVLVIISKLSLLQDPGWDLAHVRHMVDVSTVLGRSITRFQDLKSLKGGNGSGFTRFLGLMQRMKAWYESNKINLRGMQDISPLQDVNIQPEVNESMGMGVGGNGGGDMGFNVRNLPDEDFWQAIMSCSFDGVLMES
ncbi:hypothetical protein K440DRAFT_661906 [Wilcoxina mikolae CBS 423.85]|nr:hypothetical protein K440DRAFT_661906 [Wilcoxina mikolae CBS 423.85]